MTNIEKAIHDIAAAIGAGEYLRKRFDSTKGEEIFANAELSLAEIQKELRRIPMLEYNMNFTLMVGEACAKATNERIDEIKENIAKTSDRIGRVEKVNSQLIKQLNGVK